jgi:hypothetical protein
MFFINFDHIFGKTYAINMWCYWEHIENTLWTLCTFWEHIGNTTIEQYTHEENIFIQHVS